MMLKIPRSKQNGSFQSSPPAGTFTAFLGEKGVNCIIAGGMGPSAEELCQQNISVVIGASGPIDDVVKAYLSGDLTLGSSACHH